MAFSRDESQTCLLYFIYPWKLLCHKPTSMQTLFHSYFKLGSGSSQDAEWSPSRHILMFLGVPLSVLPQQTAICPHQSSDLSVVSHSSRVGISRCYLPVQVLASSPDLPLLLAWLRSQQTYWKLFPGTSPTHRSQSRECHGLRCSLERDKDLWRPEMGRQVGLETLRGGGLGY